MKYFNGKTISGRILEDISAVNQFDKIEIKTSNDSIKDEAFIAKRHPSPIMRINLKGELIYTNDAADALLSLLTLVDRGLQLYRLGVLTQKAIHHNDSYRIQYHINQSDYRIEIVPDPNLMQADLYFTEISESVKIKNYFEVQSIFAEALLVAETVDEVVSVIVKQAIARLGYDDCVVFLLADDGETLVQRAAYGPKNRRDTSTGDPIKIKVGQGIAGSVALSRRGEIVNDTSKDSRYLVDEKVRLSEIAVPIADGDQLLGVIDSENEHRNYYTAEDLSILTSIASMAATKIQRIKSTESIKAAQEKTKILIDNAFGGIYTLRGNKFEMVNRVFKEITGYTERELTSNHFKLNNMIHRVEHDGMEAIKARANGDSSRKSYQLEVLTKQQDIRVLTVNTVILQDERGPYTLGIALDITPLIESEKKLKQLNDELTARNGELQQFAHMASHNLRAPVSNMMGLMDIYNLNEESSEHNKRVMQSLRTTTSHLNSTLEDMHLVLKVRANEVYNIEKIDLNSVFQNTIHILKEEIETSRIKITTHFDALQINYVKYHIDNFFLNLISNAIKYRSKDREPCLHITALREGETVIVSFEDNGIGIDLNRHGKDLFGMYKRFHHKAKGRGIGLYLVNSQISAMGGEIIVKSELEKGTTFSLKIKNPSA